MLGKRRIPNVPCDNLDFLAARHSHAVHGVTRNALKAGQCDLRAVTIGIGGADQSEVMRDQPPACLAGQVAAASEQCERVLLDDLAQHVIGINLHPLRVARGAQLSNDARQVIGGV